MEEIHRYQWLNLQRKQLYKGADAYFITAADLDHHPSEIFGKQFEQINAPDTILIERNQIPVRRFYVYRLKNYNPHF